MQLPTGFSHQQSSLRTTEQGCDTTIWAAITQEAREKAPPGSFLQDRKPVSQHLYGAGTQSKPEEVDRFIQKLDSYIEKIIGPGSKTW